MRPSGSLFRLRAVARTRWVRTRLSNRRHRCQETILAFQQDKAVDKIGQVNRFGENPPSGREIGGRSGIEVPGQIRKTAPNLGFFQPPGYEREWLGRGAVASRRGFEPLLRR
jgi:hypothetical protein